MKRTSLVLTAVLAACGPAVVQKVEPLDLRNALPAPDPKFFDVASGEMEIPPQSEMMFCTDLTYDGEDVAFDLLETSQGKFGHHAVLLAAKKPKESGTVVDCTDVTTMADYDAYTIGDTELPKGHGTFLPKGKKMVLQSHYLNTGKVPILVRDVVRVRKVAVADVTIWDSIFVNNSLEMVIPPHSMGVKQEFDCPVAVDTTVLMLGGHMHEWGAQFESTYISATGDVTPVYKVETWKPEYRDVPPVDLYLTAPRLFKAGGKMHTVCTWNNTSDATLKFPSEMCTLFGFVQGSKEPIICGAPKL